MCQTSTYIDNYTYHTITKRFEWLENDFRSRKKKQQYYTKKYKRKRQQSRNIY